jgi:hypothetical protein
VTAFGDYDPDAEGHLILHDLKIFIRFPPGCTILLLSASLSHGNVPVAATSTRTSFTQYCQGAFIRHVDWKFRDWADLSTVRQEKVTAHNASRLERIIGRLSATPVVVSAVLS